jgi:outer membrane protein TolC
MLFRWIGIAAVALPGLCAQGLSESDAVATALASNPEILVLRQGRVVAQTGISRLGALASPELRIGASGIATEDALSDRARNNVGLRWSPPRIGELGLKMAMAGTKVAEASGEVRAAETRLAAEVRLLHRTICLLDEQIRIAEETVRVRERILAEVNNQVQVGVKSALDRSSAEIALADARAIPDQYRAERRLQLVRLAGKLGTAFPESAVLSSASGFLSFVAPALDRHRIVESALRQRPEIAMAEARCENASLALTSARRDRYPWLSFVQVTRRGPRDDDPPDWVVQAGVDLPVFRWFGNSVTAASAELDRCRLRQQAVKAAIVSEVDEILTRLQAVSRELETHRAAIMDLSERTLGIANTQLAAGLADGVEPLLATVRLLAARQSFVARLMEFRALEAGLNQAQGATSQDGRSSQ